MNNKKITPPVVETEIDSRKREVVDKALALFVQHGYERTSIEDIALACNMSKGNFYHHFQTKEELIYLIQADIVQEQKNEIARLDQVIAEIGPRRALEHFFTAFCHGVDRHQNAYIFLNHVVIQLDSEGRRRLLQGSLDMQELFENLLLSGINQGIFKDINVKLVAHNITRLGSAWANNRWQLRKFINLDNYIGQQLQYIFQGLGIDSSVQ